MRQIIFKWNGSLHKGVIVNQRKGGILGLTTDILVSHINDIAIKMEFTIFGKCEVGPCGSFDVVSISSLN